MKDVVGTLAERGKRYGAFKGHADIAQGLKQALKRGNWTSLRPSQRKALEMIQHKIARILNGDPDYADSWHDIAGYATLCEAELTGEERRADYVAACKAAGNDEDEDNPRLNVSIRDLPVSADDYAKAFRDACKSPLGGASDTQARYPVQGNGYVDGCNI